jgi:hypothetical protein
MEILLVEGSPFFKTRDQTLPYTLVKPGDLIFFERLNDPIRVKSREEKDVMDVGIADACHIRLI